MLIFPFAAFWVLIFIGKSELGFKGIAFFVTLWLCLFLGWRMLHLPSYWFTAVQALIDVVLIIVIFGGDIRIS